MANKRITQLPTAPQVEDNDYLPIDNISTPTAENEGGTRKILVKDITAKSADAVEYDNTTSGLEADNVQDAIDEVLEEGGKVQDVYENGESVVDPTDKIARIHGHKEVTQAQYDALPSSKLTDGILYCIKDAEFSAEDVPYDNSDSGLESEDVQSAVDEIADVLGALKVEGTVENQSIATFTDGSSLPMPKLEIAVEPQQDLHGYDAPWVGGGGKNKFDQDTVYASYKQSDGSFRLTANNAISIKNYIPQDLVNKQLTFSVYVDLSKETSPNYIRTIAEVGGSLVNGTDVSSGNKGYISVTFTPTSTDDFIYFTYGSGGNNYFTMNDLMLEVSSARTAFAPYSNICPISGWSAVDVTRTGKNLVNWKWNTFNDGKMEIFLKGGTYTLSAESALTNGNAYIRGTKLSGEYVSREELGLTDWGVSSTSGVYYGGGGQQTYTFNIPNGGAKIEFGKLNNNGTISAQLEFGSTATAYEPYNGQTYTIDLNGTYYGGKLDVVSGVLTVDRVLKTVADCYWYGSNGFFYTGTVMNEIVHGDGRYDHCISDVYATKNVAQSSSLANGEMSVDASGYLQLKDARYSSTSDFKTAMGTSQFVYELATPLTIQLTPTQVNSLMGVNNIWANCGKINKAVYIRDLNIVINNLLNA